MEADNRAALARRIYAAAHLTGSFRLRSGVVADEYFDKYLFEAEPALLREVGHALVGLLPDDTGAVAGLELGGIPLATTVSQISGLPALFVRKQPKPYGTCRLAEGGEVNGRRLAVIEDVVTSGGQLMSPVLRCASGGPNSSPCSASLIASRAAVTLCAPRAWTSGPSSP